MELKKAIEDIKLYIDAEQVKNKIATDLGIHFKSGKCKCFLHNSSSDTVMSFDAKAKKFKCFGSCGQSYDIFNHYQAYYNMNFVEAIQSIIREFNIQTDIILKDSDRKPKKAPLVHEKYNDRVLSYCEKRKISKSTIDYIGIKENNNNVCFEYKNELGEHVANKYRFTKKDAKPKMLFEEGTNINTLFNMDKVNISEPLLITEGEFDCLAAIESGFKNSVSIPSGVNSTNKWIDANWSWIEQFEEIIIWFDNDEAGINGSREVFNRLPNKSVKIVYCKDANDINELLYKFGKSKVLEAISKASTPLIDGTKKMSQIGRFNIHEADVVETGFANIDDVIVGIPYGSLNVITGRSGEGKSTILNQICIGQSLKEGHKVFLFSGELMEETVKGWSYHTLANDSDLSTFTSKKNRKYKTLTSYAEDRITDALEDRFILYTSDDYGINGIISKMEILAKRYGVKVFCIDNLMVAEDDEKDEYRSQTSIVKKLKSFAKKYKAIVHLVAHPRKNNNGDDLSKNEVAGSGNITNLADYVMIVRRVKNEDGSDDYTSFKIDKNRYTGKLISIRLKFDDDRRRFYSSSEKLELGVDYLNLNQQFIQVEGEW